MKWEDGFAFELSEEEKMVQQAAREFAEAELKPQAAKMDQVLLQRHQHKVRLLKTIQMNKQIDQYTKA